MGMLYKIDIMNLDKIKLGSICLNIILLLALGILGHQYYTFNCQDYLVGDNVIVVPVKDTKPKEVANYRPAPKASVPIANLVAKKHTKLAKQLLPKVSLHNVSVLPDSSALPRGAVALPLGEVCYIEPGPCDTVNIYSDTITKADSHTIVINDTIQGTILGRSVLFVNLQPSKIAITDKWRVYVGVTGIYNARYFDRWGIGPSAALAIPKVGQIDYAYDVRNNTHTAGFKALIRFKK